MKKPFRSLRNSLQDTNGVEDVDTKVDALLLALRTDSAQSIRPAISAPNEQIAVTNRRQQSAGTVPLSQDGNHAISLVMSGPYPMIRRSRPMSLPPSNGPMYGTLLAANRCDSIRGRSSIQLDPPHRGRYYRPQGSGQSHASSASQHSRPPVGTTIRRRSVDLYGPPRLFTQQELDHAFRNVVVRSQTPDSAPELVRAESGMQILEALIRDFDEASGEWNGYGSELLEEYWDSDGHVEAASTWREF